jgi:DNA-directed RNA polymerase specialized sigma24 family protein
MKYEEIAEIMDCKVGTVKARVHWALKDLSQIYRELTKEEAS